MLVEPDDGRTDANAWTERGSVLRGEDLKGCDLDILVDPLPGAAPFARGGLQVDLEEFPGVPADLATHGDLTEKSRNLVLKEARKT